MLVVLVRSKTVVLLVWRRLKCVVIGTTAGRAIMMGIHGKSSDLMLVEVIY
jgi:hypothetical protein